MDEVTRWPHLIYCVSKVGGFFFPPKLTGFPSPSFTQRISYCTADKMHDKVFAYIVQSQHNETLECHAFLCPKRKTVSQLCVFLSIFLKKKTQNNHIAKDKEKSGRENRKGGDGGIPLQHSLHLWGLNNEPLPPLPSPRQFCSGQNGPVTSGHVNKFPSPLDGTLRGNLFAGLQSLPVKTGSDVPVGACVT